MRRRPPRPTQSDTRLPYTTLFRSEADRANGALAPQRLRRCRAGHTAAQQQEIESLTCHGARPRLESAVAAGCPGLRRRLDAACAIGTGSYPRIILQIVMDDLTQSQREIRDEMGCRDNLAHWQPCDVGESVRVEIERGGAAPRALQVDILKMIAHQRSEEHTSELQSLMRISYAVFCLKKKTKMTT